MFDYFLTYFMNTIFIVLQDAIPHIKLFGKEKIKLLSHYVQQHLHIMGDEGVQMLLPYIADLITCPYTCVQAVWSLFNYVSQTLGPQLTANFFVPLLIQLLDGESTPKHLKLYHRSFIVQLVVRLGIKCFLTHFATLLVEATAGYKNFMLDDITDDPQLVCDTEVFDIQQFEEAAMYNSSTRKVYDGKTLDVEEDQFDLRNVSIGEDALKGEECDINSSVCH